MTATIRTPAERTCTRCGRSETWDDEAMCWRVDGDEGNVYCIHSWDITGAFKPVER